MKNFAVHLAVVACSQLFVFCGSSVANSATDSKVSVYAEEYNASSGQSYYLDLSQKSSYSPSFSEIYKIFKSALEKKSKHVEYIKNKDQADFQIVFTNIPLVYSTKNTPHINPPLPINRHSSANLKPLNITSPWLRATLYQSRHKDVVGGVLIIPVAPLQKLRELYDAAHADWDKFAANPTETIQQTSLDGKAIADANNAYVDAFIDKSKPDLPTYKSNGKPTKAQLEAAFAKQGRLAMVWAHIWNTTGTLGGVPIRAYPKIEECLKISAPFYLNLYEYLFEVLISGDSPSLEQNKYYNFLPSTRELQALSDQSGEYSCFTKNMSQ